MWTVVVVGALASFGISWGSPPAYADSLRVAPSIVVARASAEHPFDEPSLAVDPRDDKRWVAVAIVRGSALTFPDVLKDQTCASFVSADGGNTWNRHEFPVTGCADPWVVFTGEGHVIVSMVAASPVLPGQGSNGLLVFRSEDGGRTWDDTPVGLGPSHDHPVMAIDLHESSHRGWMYISSHRSTRADDGVRRYGPWIVRTRDGGKSFDDPVTVIPNNLHNFAEMPVVLSDGTVIVSFVRVLPHGARRPRRLVRAAPCMDCPLDRWRPYVFRTAVRERRLRSATRVPAFGLGCRYVPRLISRSFVLRVSREGRRRDRRQPFRRPR